jgi:abequosyltransferase
MFLTGSIHVTMAGRTLAISIRMWIGELSMGAVSVHNCKSILLEQVKNSMENVENCPKLSICLSTYNRAKFIEETLDSIFSQDGISEVEVVIVNGASPDDTDARIAPYLPKHPNLHYYRETQNSGVDGDYDKAVQFANGEYCWLMTDDDLMESGAVLQVLTLIKGAYDLVVVNAECWNADFTKNLQTRMIKTTEDRIYSQNDSDAILAELATCLSFKAA